MQNDGFGFVYTFSLGLKSVSQVVATSGSPSPRLEFFRLSMEPEQNETMRVLLGQVMAGMQNVTEQQSQQLLHVLGSRDAPGTSQEKRSDVPWPTFSAEPGENVRLWIHQMRKAFKAHKIADDDKVVNAELCLKGEGGTVVPGAGARSRWRAS